MSDTDPATTTFACGHIRCEAYGDCQLTEACPVCGVSMVVESGLWYCAGCDAYHGEAFADLLDGDGDA